MFNTGEAEVGKTGKIRTKQAVSLPAGTKVLVVPPNATRRPVSQLFEKKCCPHVDRSLDLVREEPTGVSRISVGGHGKARCEREER